jgi:hypothetical protein
MELDQLNNHFQKYFIEPFDNLPMKKQMYRPMTQLTAFLDDLKTLGVSVKDIDPHDLGNRLMTTGTHQTVIVSDMIINDYFTNWKNEEGFFNIKEPNNFNFLDNENPSLFMGQMFSYYWLLVLETASFAPMGNKTVEEPIDFMENWVREITVRDDEGLPIQGLFHRTPRSHANPGADDEISRDEYTGIVAMDYARGVAVNAISSYAEEILDYGDRWGHSFNDREEEPGITKNWFRYARQGGDYLYYKVTAGKRPSPFEMLWFFLSALISVLRVEKKGKTGFQTSGLMMHALRMETMLSLQLGGIGIRDKFKPVQGFLKILGLFYIVWTLILKVQVYRKRKTEDFHFFSEDYLWDFPLCAVSRVYFKNPNYPLNNLLELLFSYRKFKKEVLAKWSPSI